jgi:hypothetical protein
MTINDPAATLEPNGHNKDGLASTTGGGPQRARGAVKFTFPGGSRPLSGYTVKRGIGVGGFGEVYYATSDAGKEVALKHIQRNMDVELRGVSQCLNLKHPHLLALFDIRYDDDGDAWVVMEYVNGESLKDVLDRNPHGLPPEEVERWFTGIAAGVAYLHDHGIVHRDLKPGNIFIDDGVVKIGDYGLSKFISVSRRSGQTESVGTFHYMAPEIGKGCYGKEVDIYALGIILHEMLTGNVPFDGESSQEIMMKHLTAEPNLSDLPAPCRGAIGRALAKDPDERYANVGAMLVDLGWERGPSPAIRPVAGDPVVSAAAPRGPRSAGNTDPPIRAESADGTLYIADDEGEMVFGPLTQLSVPAPTAHVHLRPASPPEPIAGAVQSAWTSLAHWWNNARLPIFAKLLLLVGAVVLLAMNAGWIVPVGIALAITYAVYLLVRLVVTGGTTAGADAIRTDQVAGGAPANKHRGRRKRRDDAWRDAVRARPPRERLTELLGSMLMASATAGILSLVMLLVSGHDFAGSYQNWVSYFAWMFTVSVAGAWAILAAGKVWEGNKGEQILRRFALLAVGLLVGAAAWGVDVALMVQPAFDLDVRSVSDRQLPSAMYDPSGSPTLPVYLVYFAGLFFLVRWWLQADPARYTRLSLWSTTVCVLWAGAIHLVWPFPQPWGLMIAAIMSIAVQISAPWASIAERTAAAGELAEA